MIGHEDIRVHRAAMCRRGLCETRQGQAVIVGMEEDRWPIIPPLDDMLWDVWECLPGRPGQSKPPHGSKTIAPEATIPPR